MIKKLTVILLLFIICFNFLVPKSFATSADDLLISNYFHEKTDTIATKFLMHCIGLYLAGSSSWELVRDSILNQIANRKLYFMDYSTQSFTNFSEITLTYFDITKIGSLSVRSSQSFVIGNSSYNVNMYYPTNSNYEKGVTYTYTFNDSTQVSSLSSSSAQQYIPTCLVYQSGYLVYTPQAFLDFIEFVNSPSGR